MYQLTFWIQALGNMQKNEAICTLECMEEEIGNGHDTLLWYEPWLNEGRLVDMVDQNTPQQTHSYNWKVDSLIHNGAWTLTIPVLSSQWTSISCIRISAQDDRWRWKATSSGDFSFSSAWNAVREPSSPFELYYVIWFPSTSPKMSCCLLKGLMDSLPTRARLTQFGITSY